jgi:hypothetical protein
LDTIVLTVRATNHFDAGVLAGAKIPVSKIRFPLQFSMFPQNLLVTPEQWEEVKNDDLLVQAKICPEGASALPCPDAETIMRAEGIAKAIRNLPGLEEGTQIRAAASIQLQ